jgi:outer membrane protein assembly factor BamB
VSKLNRFVAAAVLLAWATAAAGAPAAEEWPQWRGPRGDGISRETIAATKWPKDGPKQLWSAKVGIGHSTPVVAGGKVYLFHLLGDQDTLTCFDAQSGTEAWSASASKGWTEVRNYPGSRATPTIDGKRIYTYGGAGDLVAWDLDSGKPAWHLNVLKETGAEPLTWGQASSPFVVGDRIFVQSGAGGPVAVAVNKNTGKIDWKSEPGMGGYATIIQADVGGKPQLIVFGGQALYGMDPQTGKTLWQTPWPTEYDVNAATPVYHEGKLFITSAYNKPPARCAQFAVSSGGVKKLWENRDLTCRFQPPVLDRGYLYGNSEGTVRCLNWADGRVQWEAKGGDTKIGMGGSLLRLGDDKIITLSDHGELALMQATPKGVKLLTKSKLFDGGTIWSTPIVYDGKLYAKGMEEFVCLDVSGK